MALRNGVSPLVARADHFSEHLLLHLRHISYDSSHTRLFLISVSTYITSPRPVIARSRHALLFAYHAHRPRRRLEGEMAFLVEPLAGAWSSAFLRLTGCRTLAMTFGGMYVLRLCRDRSRLLPGMWV